MRLIFDLNHSETAVLSNWTKIQKNSTEQWIWSLGPTSRIHFYAKQPCVTSFIISAHVSAKKQKAQILIDNIYLANIDGYGMNKINTYRYISKGGHFLSVNSNIWNSQQNQTPDWSWSKDPISVFFNRITIQCVDLPTTKFSYPVGLTSIFIITVVTYLITKNFRLYR